MLAGAATLVAAADAAVGDAAPSGAGAWVHYRAAAQMAAAPRRRAAPVQAPDAAPVDAGDVDLPVPPRVLDEGDRAAVRRPRGAAVRDVGEVASWIGRRRRGERDEKERGESGEPRHADSSSGDL
jgi:hypothetical protein